MKRIALFAVLILTAMLLFACGGNDEAPAAPAEDAPMEIVVETEDFTAAVNDFTAAVGSLEAKVDALIEASKPPVKEGKAETGGGEAAIVLDEDREPLVTTILDTDDDGNPVTLECGLAKVINNPAFIYQKAVDADGNFKENKAGNFLMQPAPNMDPLNVKVKDSNGYTCVESPAIRVDGGSVFRLQYAQMDQDDAWRGLGADWHRCCFVNFDDIAREYYP